MKVVVFGANGPTGQNLVAQALAEGHAVTAFTRHPETFPLRDPNLRVERGDVYDAESVERAVAGQDAVLSCLGVPYGRQPITVYSAGLANITRAMTRQGVRRLVCVSSTAVDRRYDTGGGFFFEKVVTPLIANTMGRTIYADMQRMEAIVSGSGLDWTIVRPSGLFVTPGVNDYTVTEGLVTGQFTSRADLANCMLRELGKAGHVRKTVAVATVSVRPSMLKLIASEAFKRQPKPAASERAKESQAAGPAH